MWLLSYILLSSIIAHSLPWTSASPRIHLVYKSFISPLCFCPLLLILFCSGTLLFRYCFVLVLQNYVPVLQNYVLVTSCSITYLVSMPKWYDLCHVLNIVFTLGNWRYGLISSCSFYQGSFNSRVELFFTLMCIFLLHFYTQP